jgi:hypothetical protein
MKKYGEIKTYIFRLEIDAKTKLSRTKLVVAIERALDVALDADIEGAEILNHDTIGYIQIVDV